MGGDALAMVSWGSVNLHFKLRKENSMGLRPAAAQVGDVAHLNEDGGLVGPGQGDFEIRCNSV